MHNEILTCIHIRLVKPRTLVSVTRARARAPAATYGPARFAALNCGTTWKR